MVEQKALDEKLEQLRHEYERLLPRKLMKIKEAWQDLRTIPLEESNLKLLYRLVHSLAGSGRTFGFSLLSEVAREVEGLLVEAEEKGLPITEELSRRIENRLQALGQSVQHKDPHVEPINLAKLQLQQDPIGSHARLFLMSNDAIFSQRLRAQLNYFDFDISLFPDTNSLLAACNEEHGPAAVIWDLGNSDLGQSPAPTVKIGNRTVPSIVLIPRGPDAGQWLQAIQAGAAACFAKPLNMGRFIEKLHEMVSPRQEEPYRLFIVDDDKVLSSHIATIMEKAGMVVQVQNEPNKALQPLYRFRPDLILMDLHMPQCSGLDLARVIRQHEEFVSTPIVYLSSDTQINKRLEALDLGADDFLIKPIPYRYLYFSLSSRMRRARALRRYIECDSLTGLANHTSLWQQMSRALAKAAGNEQNLSFALLNIDHFHDINEDHGHAAGDRVLRSLALLLQRRIRTFGRIGRYGGEEFAIVIPNQSERATFEIIEQIREDFSEIVHDLDLHAFHTTLSAGIASFPRFKSARQISKAAEIALITAKKTGRNKTLIAPRNLDELKEQWPEKSAREEEAAGTSFLSQHGEISLTSDDSANFTPFSLSADDDTFSFDSVAVPLDEHHQIVENPDPKQPTPKTPPMRNGEGDPIRVVVVDDEREIREMIATTLSELGYDAVACADGDAGYDACMEHKPHVLITDLLLFPGIHGFELCSLVRQSPELKDTRILVMTGVYKSYRYRLEAQEAGVDIFMEKPLNMEQLLGNVKQLATHQATPHGR
ncbi:response regulator [Acanthopleuribacter pedis]|uniref:diguanylate cyclase n=1 Tax=Acanthopleuribacter pedis TaxID=442870 RepID=A0A8J7U7T2_9BACT|nr:response regulator [Acanthopleuribacter pedis]MBO1322858.1 response regulator [Acanthopleuribacter pedis]